MTPILTVKDITVRWKCSRRTVLEVIHYCSTCPAVIVGGAGKARRAGWVISKESTQCKVCATGGRKLHG